MRGADLLVKMLNHTGVTRLFTLSGNQIMPVYDACIDQDIEIVHTRHEAAAVHMADAYAQLTGQVGIALVTAGPGFANALGPLVAARASESPVLLLSGDAPIAQDGRGAFQELPQRMIVEGLTKGSVRAMSADLLADDVANALHLAASGRPGPVHLALPIDILEAETGPVDLPDSQRHDAACEALSPQAICAFLNLIDAAHCPLILAGPALSGTRSTPTLKDLSGALSVPVISMESPRGLKDASLGNLKDVLGQADLVVSLGKSIDFSLGFGAAGAFGEDCRWIVFDAEKEALRRARRNLGNRLGLEVRADPKEVIKALIGQKDVCKDFSVWKQDVEMRCTPDVSALSQPRDSEKILPAELCAAIQRQIAKQPKSLVILDGGEFCQWAQAGLRADERLTNGPAGAIGGGLCYAIAAKLARPDATIFAIMGDGTVGFHLAEFETALRINAPFVVVIGNDARWNAEHQIQLQNYGPDRLISCELTATRYDLAVRGLGGHREHVTDLAGLDLALERAIASNRPACVNVEIEGLPAPGGVPH